MNLQKIMQHEGKQRQKPTRWMSPHIDTYEVSRIDKSTLDEQLPQDLGKKEMSDCKWMGGFSLEQ